MARCAKLSVTPELYMGIVALDGLNVGDNVHTYLRRAAGDASDNEPSLYECSSGNDSDDEPEIEVKLTPVEIDSSGKSGTATTDFAGAQVATSSRRRDLGFLAEFLRSGAGLLPRPCAPAYA